MPSVDLHIHTTASDGTVSPADVVAEAKAAGLSAIAITDHDTVTGIPEALAAGAECGIEVIPGIELSTRYEGPVHILGYCIDCDNPDLKSELKGIVDDRDTRNEKLVSLMRAGGISISYDDMKSRFGEVIGRPHFATVLIESGLCSSTEEAFSRFLAKGQKYWLPRTTVPLERCIEVIRLAGGVPVIAHPFEYSFAKKSLSGLIDLCVGCGALGIECRHSSHEPGQMAYLELLAAERGLLRTGGSDYHGSVKPDIRIGCGKGLVSVPYFWLEEIKKKASSL